MKTVEQLEMSYALSKFQHELGIAKSLKTGLLIVTVEDAIDEIKKFCEQLKISSLKVELLSANLKRYILRSTKDEGVLLS